MSRGEELTEQDVVAHLSRAAKPASVREIARGLALDHDGRRALPKILARLKRSGDVEEIHGGRFRLAGGAKANVATPASRLEKPAGRDAPRAGPPARDANWITGRLVAHRDGYGFVVPDSPVAGMEGDLFIGRDNLGDAMHGDRVAARIVRRGRDGRAEGRIERVAERAHPTVVGLFRRGARGNTVLPYEARLPQEIVIPPGEEIPRAPRGPRFYRGGRPMPAAELDGAVVDVELTRFPRGGVAPAGRVVEILGRPGDFGIDVEIMIRKHHLPHRFPDEVAAAARAEPQEVSTREADGRRDFRALRIVTIDGETAKDFDDAVHVARRPGGGYELQVHIADVAHYVARGSALDREARLRGTSVYFPDRAVPMLPEELSNGICSLKPEVERLVLSAVLEMDAHGAVTNTEFMPGVIRSAERMTYTDVNKVLEGEAKASRRYVALAAEFGLMKELALVLNARRTRRGSIDFDLPEPVIEFDAHGRMTAIVRSERNIAHRIIEEFMLAANEAVAAYLERRATESLHRVHEKPDAKKVLEFEELARAFGYSLGVAGLAERVIAVKHGRVPAPAHAGRMGSASGHGPDRSGHGRERRMTVSLPGTMDLDIRPQHYQKLTQKIAGKPEERIVSYLMLRSLKQARYAAEPLGHFALAAEHYTHFTSPIRRYPDLIVHRILKWALTRPQDGAGLPVPKGKKSAGETPRGLPAAAGLYGPTELDEIAEESSEAERRADGAERELMDWKTAKFMEEHLGEEYDGIITSVQKFGYFVELLELFVEGLVPINSLEEMTGARCVFRERDRVIVTESASAGRGPRFHRSGRRGKDASGRIPRVWRLGQRVRVRVERIDPFRHRAEFAQVAL